MANKKIWELPSWVSSGNTFNNTIPIDNNFVTQKISLSAITEYIQNNITVIFTGNTSGNCINELHVENLYGCSPIKVWDEVNFLSSVSAVTYYGNGSNLVNVVKYNEITYGELYSLYTGGTLVPGSYYLITDYQTCYDQPNFNNVGDPIINDNYKTGVIEPLLVFTTSVNTLSPQAYSTQYPLDKITYDINFTTTEVTSNPAKGRITERIDDKNNRADYDFRAVQFIRYEGFFSEQLLDGIITIDPTGLITGVETIFNSDFVVGDILGVYSNFGQAPIGSFGYFEITSITSDTEMYVTGTTIPTISDTYYSRGISLPQHMSPFQCNVTSSNYTGFSEYYTFNNNLNLNTYLGDFNNYNTFLLSNNVFLSGTYRNNYFGGGVEGNTFNEDMDSNTCGSNFKYNIITNDFDDNTVGTDFQRNIIDCDMDGNLIGERFQDNMIGDDDGFDFDNNRIGVDFSSNFITMSQDGFRNNNIGGSFYNNIIDTGFENNQLVGGFYDNLLDTINFTNNIIGESFFGNKVYSDFIVNTIGPSFFNNNIYGSFESNTIGDNFNNNTLGDINNIGISAFNENKIGDNFSNNTITQDFYKNYIGISFNNNDISGQTTNNVIGNLFENNTIYNNFIDNQIFNEFKGNLLYNEFNLNKVDFGFTGNEFSGVCSGNIFGPYTIDNDFLGDVFVNRFVGEVVFNVIGPEFSNNNIGVAFYQNTISQDFQNNEIGSFFQYNIIAEGFGFGGGGTQKNYIGDSFQNNNVGEYFYNNRVANNFTYNIIGDYFQWNVIDTIINSTDFTTNYGNITTFTYTTLGTGTTDGIYTNLNGTTSGNGVNSSFNIEVSGNTVIGVSGNTSGKLYNINDTITISGTQIGGVTGVINGFSSENLSVKIYKPADSTYVYPSNEIEMDYLINNSPLFDTYYSSNIQGVSYSTKTGTDQDNYGMVIEGYIKIPSNNTYYFGLSSDDGSDAFINGVKVADWYGPHGDSGNVPSGNQYPITLTAGTHSVKVRLQERSGGDIVILLYSLDGISWNIIPNNWFTFSTTGTTGTYSNINAQGGDGTNAAFDVIVVDGLVDSVTLSNGGGSYLVGNVLTISGSTFGGTEDITIVIDSVYSDDVIVTVTGVSPNPSVYETYTCQIFERQDGNKRLSYYDTSDILTIKNINE